MRGRSQAAMVAAAAAVLSLIVPMIGLISSAAVALVTLRKGAREGLIVGSIAGLASGMLAFATLGRPDYAIGFALALWLPIWTLGIVLRQSRSLDLTIHVAALFGLVIVAGIHLQADDPTDYWTELLEPLRESLVEGGVVGAAVSEQLIAQVSRWMTGAFAASFYFQLLLALFIGRWWQALLYHPGGFGTELRGFRVQRGAGYLAVGLLVLVLLLDPVMWASELLLLLAPLFFIQGVAIAHSLAHSYSAGRGWLIGFYALLVVLMPHAEILVTGLGLVDVWFDVRARVAARVRGQG
jgi:hypothetical protein